MHEERYSRPVPSAEVVAAADFTVKAIKFCNEHTGVKWTQLRPLWVWKRKDGNTMNKLGGYWYSTPISHSSSYRNSNSTSSTRGLWGGFRLARTAD